MISLRARIGRGVLVAALCSGCGASFIPVRPSEPVTATSGTLAAEVTRLWLTDDVRDVGLDDEIDLVVELMVRNDGSEAHTLAPGSFECLMEIDARRPSETRALQPGGGGEGAFPGAEPDEGSLLAPVTIPAGRAQTVWALFHGYRFAGSERARRITLRAPFDAGVLALDLADPARGDLRWQTPPENRGIIVGLKDLSLVGGAMHATAPSSEVAVIGRRGGVLWDLGLVSTVLVETQGPLVSSTSAFSGSGLSGHLTTSLVTWGPPQNPRQLGVFAGGSASLLLEITSSAVAREKKTPHAYGLLTAEGGLDFGLGALPFAPSPFPLAPANRPLPRWSLRLGYVQAWADGVTSGGYMTSLRFVF